MKLGPYDTWIFDCDGVLLDSNQLKSEAFGELAQPFGAEAAQQLMAFHKQHGGVSRFEKVRHFVRTILGRPPDLALEAQLAQRYGELVVDKLHKCATLPGVDKLLAAIPARAKRYVVSGGLEDEVRGVLGVRFPNRFDGIFGSPRNKDDIFSELRQSGALKRAVFFGDAAYDGEVATRFGVDFVFVYGATELVHWERTLMPKRPVRWLTDLEVVDA